MNCAAMGGRGRETTQHDRNMIFSSKYILRKNLKFPRDGERKAAQKCLALYIGWVGGKRRARRHWARTDGGGARGAHARRGQGRKRKRAPSTAAPGTRPRPTATRDARAQPLRRTVAAHIRHFMLVTLYRVGGWAAASTAALGTGGRGRDTRDARAQGRMIRNRRYQAATKRPHIDGLFQTWKSSSGRLRLGVFDFSCTPSTAALGARPRPTTTRGARAQPLRRVGLPR